MTKYQGAPVRQQDAITEGDHSLTMPAPPPSLAYQPVPTVRTPMPPLASTESGVHRAVHEWPDEEPAELAADSGARDTVPSPPPEGAEEQEDAGSAAGDGSSTD